jgi:hypothetical protein
MSEEFTAEDAVRRYLMYVADPTSVRDDAAIAAAERAVEDARDPLSKLKALSALERVRAGDEGDRLKMAFMLHARAWAETNDVSIGAFRSMGVSDDVLAGAGFVVPRGGRRSSTAKARPARSTPARSGGGRARAVPVGAVTEHILGREGTFTLNDVLAQVGGTPATATRAIRALVDEGAVTNLGPDPAHSARGRAPFLYEVTRR